MCSAPILPSIATRFAQYSLVLFLLTACSHTVVVKDQDLPEHLIVVNPAGGLVCPFGEGKGCEPNSSKRGPVTYDIGKSLADTVQRIQAEDNAVSTRPHNAASNADTEESVSPITSTSTLPPCKRVEPLGDPSKDEIRTYTRCLLKRASEYANESDTVKLLLYIHGGLNTYADGIERAECQYQSIMNDGYYPLFVVWNSDGPSSYYEYLAKTRNGTVSSSAKVTAPFYLLSDTLASVGNLFKAWIVTGKNFWDARIDRDKNLYDLTKFSELDPSVPVYRAASKNHSSTQKELTWAVTTPIRIVTTPFAYTMPKSAWDIMLRRTKLLFTTESDFKQYEAHAYREASGVLTVLIDELRNFSISLKPKQLEITIVGHSMGGIVANQLVHDAPDLPFKRIIHMASADSIQNLMDKTVPYLIEKQRNSLSDTSPSVEYYGLMLDPERESTELAGWGMLPSGSLLVWIDSMYTAPETLMSRTSGRWENMNQVLRLFPSELLEKGYLRFKIFGQEEDQDLPNKWPQSHGQFDDFAYWTEPFVWDDREVQNLRLRKDKLTGKCTYNSPTAQLECCAAR